MGKRRTLVSVVVFVVLIGAFGACSGDDSKNGSAKQSQTAKAKATAKKAKQAARKKRARAAARRSAIVAAIRKQNRGKKRPRAVLASANPTPASDLAIVVRTVRDLNNAFKHQGVAAGIRSSLAKNYWVTTGVYSGRQCAQFERNRGSGMVAEVIFVGRRRFRPSPGWVDPVIGRTPKGRIYEFPISIFQNQVRSGEWRRRASVIHATVQSGRAHLFFRCD